ncbi:TetR family transcriptional regulator C-terminal domain-containing protein [Bradyrhizobium uaiense]
MHIRLQPAARRAPQPRSLLKNRVHRASSSARLASSRYNQVGALQYDRSCYYSVMKKGPSTRQMIVDTALNQSVRLGLEGVSLGNLAEDVGLSKSGLFAHFKSKEALQLAVLEEAVGRYMRLVVEPALKKPAGLPRVRALFENYLDWIAGEHEAGGCPFVTFVQEFDDRPGAIRDILAKSQRQWRVGLASAIAIAMEKREIARRADPEQVAFELIGAALAFQTSLRLLGERGCRVRALAAFDRITG